jgi:hypothetical protein
LAETDERWNSSPAQKKSQQPVEVAGFSKMGGGGFEPPTPGFSIVVSDTPESGASVEPVDGSTILTSEPEISAQQIAQQIAQHEGVTVAGGVRFPEVSVHAGTDSELRFLVDAWSELPDSVKNRILRLANDSVTANR